MTDATSDRELFLRWRGGDAEAGETLFERHFDSIYGFFENKCPTEADELVQSTFLACVHGKDTFRNESSFRTYLFAIARHQLFGYLRRRQRDRVLDFEVSSIEEVISSIGTRLARSEQHQQLLAALRRLPIDQQALLELHYMEEMGIAELAEVFEAPAVTIRSRLHRARKLLREILEKDPKIEPAVVVSLESMDSWGREQGRRLSK
jgi:RNA polymerase sigma factor (sigma-70 family)